jgi:putative FmdB family regulatory protein
MPTYEFKCKKKTCGTVFSELCSFTEFDAGFPDVRCPECNGKKVEIGLGCASALNSTDKMNNFEYAAEKNMERAQGESAAARDEARKKGLRSPYADLPDFTDNGRRMNFTE